MDLRQIEYILKIAEEKNITKAAEKLYISQPALNQQLLNLERELGTPLFQRKRGDWQVTKAGKIYLEAGRRILEIKRNAYAQIADVASTKKEELNIGMTPGKGGQILAWIFRRFYSIYPDVRLHIYQKTSHQLQKDVFSGELDLAIATVTDERDTVHGEYREFKTFELLLMMSDKNPLAADAFQDEDGALCVDLKNFREEPFAIGLRSGTNGELQERIFDEAGFVPKIYQEGGGWELRSAMVEMNLCCSIVEEHHRNAFPQSVLAFRLATHPKVTWAAIMKKGRHLSQAAMLLIDLADQYWKQY